MKPYFVTSDGHPIGTIQESAERAWEVLCPGAPVIRGFASLTIPLGIWAAFESPVFPFFVLEKKLVEKGLILTHFSAPRYEEASITVFCSNVPDSLLRPDAPEYQVLGEYKTYIRQGEKLGEIFFLNRV